MKPKTLNTITHSDKIDFKPCDKEKTNIPIEIDIYATYSVRLLKNSIYGNVGEVCQMLGSEVVNVILNKLGEIKNE